MIDIAANSIISCSKIYLDISMSKLVLMYTNDCLDEPSLNLLYSTKRWQGKTVAKQTSFANIYPTKFQIH